MSDFRYIGKIYNPLTSEQFTFKDDNAEILQKTLNGFCNTQYIPHLNKNVINLIHTYIIDTNDYETIYSACKRLSWYIDDKIAWKGYTKTKINYVNNK